MRSVGVGMGSIGTCAYRLALGPAQTTGVRELVQRHLQQEQLIRDLGLKSLPYSHRYDEDCQQISAVRRMVTAAVVHGVFNQVMDTTFIERGSRVTIDAARYLQQLPKCCLNVAPVHLIGMLPPLIEHVIGYSDVGRIDLHPEGLENRREIAIVTADQLSSIIGVQVNDATCIAAPRRKFTRFT